MPYEEMKTNKSVGSSPTISARADKIYDLMREVEQMAWAIEMRLIGGSLNMKDPSCADQQESIELTLIKTYDTLEAMQARLNNILQIL